MDFLDSGLYFSGFFDLGVNFEGLFELKIVPKLTCGSLWGSQGRPRRFLGAGLNLVDF